MGIKGAHSGSSDQIRTIHTCNALQAWLPSSAERVRRCRERQRAGLRAVRRNEIKALIMRGYLGQDAAGDGDATASYPTPSSACSGPHDRRRLSEPLPCPKPDVYGHVVMTCSEYSFTACVRGARKEHRL